MKVEFKKMILEHERLILRICHFYYKANEKEAIEDLYQDIVLNLWKSYPKFIGNQQCKASTWLYRVALNTALLQKRKEKRMTYTSLNEKTLSQTSDDNNALIKTLYQLVAQLNEEEKNIIYLYLEDLSHNEIAEILGISISNVGTKIHRIKLKLKCLQEINK